MTTYAIGDLHGCLEPLERLLDKLRFDTSADSVWFVGDLINRGPQSLQTLRYVKNLGDSAVAVLGNHDLHLLAVKAGSRKPSAKDTLNVILEAEDCERLCDWLRSRPLLHFDANLNTTMVHAGILPGWDLALAQQLAREVENKLRADDYLDFLLEMYGNKPAQWREDLTGADRLRFIINCFTRMRYVHRDAINRLDFTFNGPPKDAPENLIPWHLARKPKLNGGQLVFGHWSSLEGKAGKAAKQGVVALDMGCVWGGRLAAINIESGEMTEVSA